MDSKEDWTPEDIQLSWRDEQLKPRPGFGFYPDTVWNILELLTEVCRSFNKCMNKKNRYRTIKFFEHFFLLIA